MSQPFAVVSQQLIARGVYRMLLSGDASAICAPGQFVNVQVPGYYLRRPLSVADWTEDTLTLIYKVVGEGTDALARLPKGAMLDVLIPLGNGFDLSSPGDRPVLVGGGLGAVPMLGLARRLPGATVVLGFASREDAFLVQELGQLGCQVEVATVDGSMGTAGFVTDVMARLDVGSVFACGPEPMLRAISALYPRAQVSLEARMACGFGACMGCSIKTKDGPRRVCKDGPVFRGEVIEW